MFAEWMLRGKPSMLGLASGVVAGLVVVTPAAGLVGPMGAIILGLMGGVVCLWGVTGLKKLHGFDDSLDVFGIHCLGGVFGAIGTGVFVAPALGGVGVADYAMGHQVMVQATGVLVTLVWSGVVSFVLFKLIDMTMGLRVSEEQEREGLDNASHGESAYSA
jgi:Amt family ammonium transporter